MTEPSITPPIVPLQRLEALMGQSIDTLSAILADRSVPVRDRAHLALRLLELGLDADAGALAPPEPALPLQFVMIPDFLPAEQHAALIRTALANRERFVSSTVTTNKAGYRESQVLYATEFPALFETVKAEIMATLPAVFGGLERPAFPVTQVEMQMTAHGDGAFFKVHSDAGSPETERRELSYVYYFQARSPAGFGGGRLRIYQTYGQTAPTHDPAQFRDIEPADNSIVFFDSRLMHEVLPVSIPSGAFEDSRFTMNGWLHR
ncbi:MAG: 2OG-Fe(II) oxygenase [Acetobacteraceae bacterium]